MSWLIMIAILAAAVSSGVWLGVALGITGVVILFVYAGSGALQLIASASFSTLNSYTLIAMPLFVFMGEVLVFSGVSNKMYSAFTPFFSRFPGKLLLTNVFVCSIFGAMCGSSMATAAAVGSVAYPELDKRGYDRSTVVGSLAGAGTLGLLIPPSIQLIVYGAWEGLSVGQLFIAALVPGIMMALMFMVFIGVKSLLQPGIAPSGEGKVSWIRAILNTKDAWPALVLIFSILGTIYLGIATATEAAGIGAIVAILLAIVFRNFRFKAMFQALLATARLMGIIGFIIIGASILATSISIIGLPRQLVLLVAEAGLPPVVVLILIYVMYAALGCFFDALSMMLMTLPFTFPLIVNLGYDPIWFGIVTVMVIEMGQITPPVGVNLYVLQGITKGEVSIGEIALASLPYFLMLALGLAIITLFPQICLWLPSMRAF